MNVRYSRQRSIYEQISKQLLPDHEYLAPEAWMTKLDNLLDDEQLISAVDDALARRNAQSHRRGRKSTPSEVVLRLLVLRRVKGWSFQELEQEVRANLVYRDFSRLGASKVPDEKTLLRLEKAVGTGALGKIEKRVVGIAKDKKVIRGRKMRLDTTVTETNIHYPTDSNLLGDCLRVITRTVRRIQSRIGNKTRKFRDRSRSVKYRLIEISRAARRQTEDGKKKIERSYRKLIATSRTAMAEARRVASESATGLEARAGAKKKEAVQKLIGKLNETLAITERVIEQTKARVIDHNDHFKGKVLSIFEGHTEAIRKGKAAKPTEFGKMIKIQEAENRIITSYEVYDVRPADSDLLVPAIEEHKEIFGRAPDLVAADAGFFSAANEREAKQAGVKKVAIPSKKSRSPARREIEKARWFRRAQRWRVGCEGVISVVKRRSQLARCRNRGKEGMERWVGWGVVTHNLITIAKAT